MRDFSEDVAVERVARPRGPSNDNGQQGLNPSQATVVSLQRTAGNASVAGLLGDDEQRSPVLDVVGKGGGRALDDDVRAGMETRLGADFSGVRVHDDPAAAASAASVQAHAYTVGEDIVFGAGRYDPASTAGQRTLAHELTHVVQQRQGDVDGAPAGGGIRVSTPSDRFERQAEATADAVTSGVSAGPVTAAPASSVQRAAADEDEEEPVQALAIQRQAPEEEEQPETAE